MTTYDITYEYRADFDGHEIAGHVVARNITEAIKLIGGDEGRSWGVDHVEVRFVAEVKRTNCCQRGDWDGVSEAADEAEADDDRLWECIYCGRIGNAEELNRR